MRPTHTEFPARDLPLGSVLGIGDVVVDEVDDGFEVDGAEFGEGAIEGDSCDEGRGGTLDTGFGPNFVGCCGVVEVEGNKLSVLEVDDLQALWG